MTIHELISNFGGQLGLWAGISVLTVAQAIIYLCTALCRLHSKIPSKEEPKSKELYGGWLGKQAKGARRSAKNTVAQQPPDTINLSDKQVCSADLQ